MQGESAGHGADGVAGRTKSAGVVAKSIAAVAKRVVAVAKSVAAITPHGDGPANSAASAANCNVVVTKSAGVPAKSADIGTKSDAAGEKSAIRKTPTQDQGNSRQTACRPIRMLVPLATCNADGSSTCTGAAGIAALPAPRVTRPRDHPHSAESPRRHPRHRGAGHRHHPATGRRPPIPSVTPAYAGVQHWLVSASSPEVFDAAIDARTIGNGTH